MRAANRLTQPGNTLKMRLQLLSGVGGFKSSLIAPKTAWHSYQGRSATAVARELLSPGTSLVHSSTFTSSSDEEFSQFEVSPGAALVQPAAKRRKALSPQPCILPGVNPCAPPCADSSGSSSRMLHGGAAEVGAHRARQMRELQTLLGYSFRNANLLDQACTHDSTGSQPSYRELAFVGDAVLWLLFAEHAVKAYGSTEDPISGNWPTHLSRLLSRASCAATARQWGLDAYLQHSTPRHGVSGHIQQQQHSLWQQGDTKVQESQQLYCQAVHSEASSSTLQVLPYELSSDTSTSSSSSSSQSSSGTGTDGFWPSTTDSINSTSSAESNSSSSSSSSSSRSIRTRSRAMHAGVWTSDTLAEMFEGVVGALLLDCGSEYETLKQLLLPWVASSLAASKQQAATGPAASDAAPAGASGAACAAAAVPPLGTAQHAHAAELSTPLQVSGGVQQLQDLQDAIDAQLQERCGFCFTSQQPLAAASQHMLQLMLTGSCCAEAESGRFLGFSILQFAAVLQAYCMQHSNRPDSAAGEKLWPAQLLGQQPLLQEWVDWGPVSANPRVRVPGKSYKVHQMSKHGAELTTVRHRAKMLLMLLDGTPWSPADSFLTNSSWKKQKQTLARCLDVLLAAVYVDSGLEAAIGMAGVLVRTTPPTTHEKSWMPVWARQQTRSKAV